MRTIAQSELGETAARLLREADGDTIVISDGRSEIAALISMEQLRRLRQAQWEEMDRISREASAKMEAHAAQLGISPEELVKRLLLDEG